MAGKKITWIGVHHSIDSDSLGETLEWITENVRKGDRIGIEFNREVNLEEAKQIAREQNYSEEQKKHLEFFENITRAVQEKGGVVIHLASGFGLGLLDKHYENENMKGERFILDAGANTRFMMARGRRNGIKAGIIGGYHAHQISLFAPHEENEVIYKLGLHPWYAERMLQNWAMHYTPAVSERMKKIFRRR